MRHRLLLEARVFGPGFMTLKNTTHCTQHAARFEGRSSRVVYMVQGVSDPTDAHDARYCVYKKMRSWMRRVNRMGLATGKTSNECYMLHRRLLSTWD